MDYNLLHALHVATVALSLALFLLRAFWMLADSPLRHARWTRIAPHVNDTVLLTTAIGMLVTAGLNPLEHAWLQAKLLALLAYIALGGIALKRGRTRRMRVIALICALGAFAYMVAVAVTQQALPGLS